MIIKETVWTHGHGHNYMRNLRWANVNATKLVWLASVFHRVANFMSGLLSGAIAGLQGLGTHNDLVRTSLRWETWKRKQTGETERTTKHTDTRLPTKETMMARHRHETRNNKKTETRNNLRCTRENLNYWASTFFQFLNAAEKIMSPQQTPNVGPWHTD